MSAKVETSVKREMSGTVSKTSTTSKSSKYVYRSTGGAGADVTIEYSTDLSALSRLEVLFFCQSLLVYANRSSIHNHLLTVQWCGEKKDENVVLPS